MPDAPRPLRPDVLTVKEAAAYLRKSPNALYRALLDGTMPGFPAVRVGANWRIGREALERYLNPQPVRRGPARLRAIPKRYRRRDRAS
jgi:excisionase family DNA binding protein